MSTRLRFIGGCLHGRTSDYDRHPPGRFVVQHIAVDTGIYARDFYQYRESRDRAWLGFHGRQLPHNLPRWLRRSWLRYQHRESPLGSTK